jgi:hypothetical protein
MHRNRSGSEPSRGPEPGVDQVEVRQAVVIVHDMAEQRPLDALTLQMTTKVATLESVRDSEVCGDRGG